MKKLLLLIPVAGVAVGAYVLLRGNNSIPVTIVESRAQVGDLDALARRWYASDRARMETRSGGESSVFIVRLDKKEVWTLDEQSKTCTIRRIADIYAEAKKASESALSTARRDPAWQRDLPALERYMRGEYEVSTSPRKVAKLGYDCTEISVRLGNVFRARALVASDKRFPPSAGEVGEVSVLLSGLGRGMGEAARHWRRKRRAFGNVLVSTEKMVRGITPGASRRMSAVLVSVDVERVNRGLFEIPDNYSIGRKSP